MNKNKSSSNLFSTKAAFVGVASSFILLMSLFQALLHPTISRPNLLRFFLCGLSLTVSLFLVSTFCFVLKATKRKKRDPMKKGNETMEKAQQPTSILGELRNNRRDKHREHQDFSRLKAFEASRFVEAELVTEKDIAGLCSRIKRKKRASAEDLIKLSNAFIQSEKNITAFVKTTGAINIIVKEFTGNDKHQQILAAQLLCNLSLGDESSCSKIASFVGSYLMIMIMSSDFCLSVSYSEHWHNFFISVLI